jgi:hypothetical protein
MPVFQLKPLISFYNHVKADPGAGFPHRQNCRTAADFAGLFTPR